MYSQFRSWFSFASFKATRRGIHFFLFVRYQSVTNVQDGPNGPATEEFEEKFNGEKCLDSSADITVIAGVVSKKRAWITELEQAGIITSDSSSLQSLESVRDKLRENNGHLLGRVIFKV